MTPSGKRDWRQIWDLFSTIALNVGDPQDFVPGLLLSFFTTHSWKTLSPYVFNWQLQSVISSTVPLFQLPNGYSHMTAPKIFQTHLIPNKLIILPLLPFSKSPHPPVFLLSIDSTPPSPWPQKLVLQECSFPCPSYPLPSLPKAN